LSQVNPPSERQAPVQRVDRELEEFRSLMEVPSTFEEGFTWPAFIGTLFVALVMVPGSIYMGLVAGGGVGPAAQWVTVILFIEVARRANKVLGRAEIYTLFYLAAAAMAMPFQGLLWNQFYAQSTAAQANGITESLPTWFAPTDPDILAKRTFFSWDWMPAIGLILFGTIMTRLNNTILGYGLFRVASDIEKLPFPMAPLGAQGILALSEEQEEENPNRAAEDAKGAKSWRWRVFSIGTVIGLAFGGLYVGLPTITGAVLGSPIQILPIPFVDWTQNTGKYLPAVATGLSLDLGNILIGMVLPFFAMVGSFIGLVSTLIGNPILYHFDILHNWSDGDNTLVTSYKNTIDFYFTFTIGISLAIALMGLLAVAKAMRQLRQRRASAAKAPVLTAAPAGRGDVRTKFIVATYAVSVILYILVSGWLIDWHPGVMTVMIFYGFLYTPIISYATARLEGIAGMVVEIPMVREASFILSGYQGAAVWFLPVPLSNYGMQTVEYRQAELTGTKFTSIWKSELFLAPIIIVMSLIFANFIWSLGPIPGPQYPFAQRMWELGAEGAAITQSSTLGGYSTFEETLNWNKVPYLVSGLTIGGAALVILGKLGLPIFLVFGAVRGLGQTDPHVVIPNLVGALIGRYYFQKRMGLEWRKFVPVVVAGYACGVGLIATFCIGLTFLAKSVFQLPF